MGLIRASKIQMGGESTAGTPVAATTIWRGKGWIDDQHEVRFPDENVGILIGTDRNYVPKYLAALKFDSVPATFEQFPYLLESGVKTVTPSQDGAGSDYISAYPFPTTAAQTIKTRTLEGGDNIQCEEVENCFVPDFELSGKANEAWMMAGNWFGRQVTKTTYTGSLSIPTVGEMLFNKSKLYIGAVAGGFAGASLISSTFLEASLKVKTGFYPFFSGDGNLYFTSADFDDTLFEAVLDIAFVHNATAVAEKDAWIAKTARALRIKIEGDAVASAGTTYSVKTALIDLPGKWEKFNAIEAANGKTICRGKFRVRYNATLASAGQITVVNELSALP
jgi:hypothetical protein